VLQTNGKYYIGDQGLKYAAMGFRDAYISGSLENIVFLELKRRGYEVFTGVIGDKEIDFVAERKGDKIYVQVSYVMEKQETVEREFGVYDFVDDHYPKYVVSMDELRHDSGNGVHHIHLADFLLMEQY
jgi:predicted AAA+ superfamily ATPase